jgi:hypothetical protein
MIPVGGGDGGGPRRGGRTWWDVFLPTSARQLISAIGVVVRHAYTGRCPRANAGSDPSGKASSVGWLGSGA